MISFEHRILSEYRLKIAKMETLSSFIENHRDPKSVETKDASHFLDLLIDEADQFYKQNGEILSHNGKKPHNRSHLSTTKKWTKNIESFYEKNPRRRPRN